MGFDTFEMVLTRLREWRRSLLRTVGCLALLAGVLCVACSCLFLVAVTPASRRSAARASATSSPAQSATAAALASASQPAPPSATQSDTPTHQPSPAASLATATRPSAATPTASLATATRPTAATPASPRATATPATATLAAVSTPAAPAAAATATPTVDGEQTGRVTHVVDGDTIDVEIAGRVFRVRYIGMNTPERSQVCGSTATRANAALVTGREVRLVKDVSETDRYGRLLRYVYVGDLFVNAELVRQGYAEAKEYPPDTAQAQYLESLEQQARSQSLNCFATGVFGGGAAGAPAPTAQSVAPAATAPAGNCDPSYPGVCIPPPPPDLDCKDIPYRRFKVLPPDPHHFDNNGDGVGCESG